jgi:hypothetical protein
MSRLWVNSFGALHGFFEGAAKMRVTSEAGWHMFCRHIF